MTRALVFTLLLAAGLIAQGEEACPVRIAEVSLPASAKAGTTVEARVRVTIDSPFHIYGMTNAGVGVATSFAIESERLSLGKDIKATPDTQMHVDPPLSYSYWEKEVTFTLPLEIAAGAAEAKHGFKLKMHFMACTEDFCRADEWVEKEVELAIEGGEAKPLQVKGPVALTKAVAPKKVKAGEPFEVRVGVRIDQPYHIYGLKMIGEYEYPTVFEAKGASLAGEVTASHPPHEHADPTTPYLYWEDGVEFTVPLKVDGKAGERSISVEMKFLACTMESCLQPESFVIPLTVEVEGESTAPATSEGGSDGAKASKVSAAVGLLRVEGKDQWIEPRKPATLVFDLGERPDLEEGQLAEKAARITHAKVEVVGNARIVKQGSRALLHVEVEAANGLQEGALQLSGFVSLPEGNLPLTAQLEVKVPLLGFLLFAIGAALLALLTPCVYPMVPVTISFFTKQSEETKSSPATLATAYCLGIIGSFVLIGAAFTLLSGSGGGAIDFATHPVTQGFIAVVFIIFALSLFGMFELQLPPSVMRLLGRAQGKGGVGGVLLLGFLFSLTTFTCTAPFVGSLLASAVSSGSWSRPMVGMLAFSTVLAIPFFFLALFPARLKSMPRSGGWLNQVKVCMGFIELAAAFKFLGAMDMILGWDLFTRTAVISAWIAIFGGMGLYLLGAFRLPHDSPREKVGVPGLCLALFSLGFAISLFAGLNGNALPGSIDAYLPREQRHRTPEGRRALLIDEMRALGLRGGGGGGSREGAPMLGLHHEEFKNDYAAARKEAVRVDAPLFLNFTGHS